MSHHELLQRHRQVMPDWLALYYDQPIELVSGEGRHVRDREGNEYLDFFGGILTTMTGHAVPEVVEAVQEQAARMLHTSTLYLIEPQIALAEEIAALCPWRDTKVFFTTSGTEANEAALLFATNARRSNQVLALRNSYHGRSFSTMAITGNRGWSASSLSPLNVSYVHGGFRFRSPFADRDDAGFIAACVEDLENILATTTAGDVACLIAEPIQGVGGFTHPPDGLLAAFKEVLDAHGILLISDEVQTGWGRTGEHFWGFQAHDVEPDMITFAKGLGNGLSIAGVAGPSSLLDHLPANSVSTFGGSPITTAGALANLRYLLRHDLQANARHTGELLRRQLEAGLTDSPIVGDIRGKGLMLGIELVHPGTTKPDPKATGRVLEAAKRRGLLVGKGGLYGNTLRVSPPLSVTEAEIGEGGRSLIAAIEEVAAEQQTERPVAAKA